MYSGRLSLERGVMFEKSKQYRTRDGREVRIYSTDTGHGLDQVHGAVKAEWGWEMSAWGYNGMKDVSGIRETLSDLIEVKHGIQEARAALKEGE